MNTTNAGAPIEPRPRRGNPIGRILGFAFVICLGCVLGYGAYLMHGSRLARKVMGFYVHPKTAQDVFPTESAINLVIVGRDDDWSPGDKLADTEARSDMLMVSHIDFAKNTVSILSIPRDTRTVIPGYGVHKINAAHAYGGPALTQQTIQANYGIPPDHYITLDLVGFQEAINILGGVDLTVDRKMDYDDNWGHLHIHLLPGYQHLDGEHAMEFVRFRHADSDFVRVKRQQALIAALKVKLARPQTLAELPALLNTIDKHVTSDLTDDQKIVLARFIQATPRANITMETLPSLDGPGTFVTTDWQKGRPMVARMFELPIDSLPDGPAASHRAHRRRHHAVEVASA